MLGNRWAKDAKLTRTHEERRVTEVGTAKKRPRSLIYGKSHGIPSASQIAREDFWLRRQGISRQEYYWVYFIQERGGSIKIGISRNPDERLTMLQRSHPHELRLLGICAGGRPLEQKLHREFNCDRLKGEWFAPSEGLLERIADLCQRARV